MLIAQKFGPLGSGWRYYQTDTGHELAGWQTESFDDTGWLVGQGGFGNVPPGDGRVVHTNWPTFNGSVIYLRITVDSTWIGATVKMCNDDSAQVYLGGSLLFGQSFAQFGYTTLGTLPSITETIFAVRCLDNGGGASYLDLEFDFKGRSGVTVG